MRKGTGPKRLTVRPLTPELWADFEQLFGRRGACGGCWCMWWRLPRAEFEKGKGEGNRRAMRSLVEADEPIGLLAYRAGRPIGWCSVAPRTAFGALERSRILRPLDDQPVWSVVCFFVEKGSRRSGVLQKLLAEATRHAAQMGARIVEGYPVEPKTGTMPDVFVYTGLASAFRKAGFVEVARRSPTRPIFRWFAEDRGKQRR